MASVERHPGFSSDPPTGSGQVWGSLQKERARACGERRLVIFLQVTKILRDREEEGCLVLKNQKIKGMETKP